MFSSNSYKDFKDKYSNHTFDNAEGIFISDNKLERNTSFGINNNGHLIILLPEKIYRSSFTIKKLYSLLQPRKFISETNNQKIKGCPFTYESVKTESQYSLLSVLNRLLRSENYNDKLYQFFELLQQASLRRDGFKAAPFFSEATVVYSLLNKFPSLVDYWRSTGKAIIDIIGSQSNPPIEIKSTTNDHSRIHKLSIHQIRFFQENPNALLASTLVRREPTGISCKEICLKMLSTIDQESKGYLTLSGLIQTLDACPEFSSELFDEGFSANSLTIFKPDFSQLSLIQPPAWLISGKLEIDFQAFPEFDL